MVQEKPDGDVCLSTADANSPMTITSSLTKAPTTTSSPPTSSTTVPNSADEQSLSAASITVDTDERPSVVNSMFTFPVPDVDASTTTTTGSCNSGSVTPTMESSEAAWPSSMTDEIGDCACSSSVVDSGLSSRCSPASSCDWQALTPSAQTSLTMTIRSPVTVAKEHPSKRSSLTQRFMGIFNKSPEKVHKQRGLFY
jgi:hypothetical protein